MTDLNKIEELSLDELRALAEQPEGTPEPVVEEEEQPRGPDGKFVATTSEVDAEPVVPTTFSRTIDLGDGSGKQVFTADSLEGLVDKLAEAQTHATRKIREQNQVLRAVPVVPKPKERTADEEYVLGQRFISEPSKAVKQLLEEEFGMPFDEIKKSTLQARQIAQERINEANAVKWVSTQPNYYPNDYNATKIRTYVNKFFGGEQSTENLDKAFADLNEAGLLQSKPEVTEEVAPVTTPPAPAKRRASSLSSRTTSTTATVAAVDPYKISMEELAALANQQG